MELIFKWLVQNKAELMNKFIYKMISNKRDAEDFYQDLFIIMSSKDEEKLLKIYNANELMPYVYIIIKNNLKSATSRFHYTYKKPIGSEYKSELDFRPSVDNTIKNTLLEEIDSDFGKLLEDIYKYVALQTSSKQLKKYPKGFYETKIFEYYYKDNNTHRGLSKLLDIPTTSIYHTVKKTTDKILVVFASEIENIKNKLIYYNTL